MGLCTRIGFCNLIGFGDLIHTWLRSVCLFDNVTKRHQLTGLRNLTDSVQHPANLRIDAVRSQAVRLKRADSVDAVRSKQILFVTVTLAALEIESPVSLHQRHLVMNAVFGPARHIRMTRFTITRLIFVDMPDRQPPLPAWQVTIEPNWLAILDQQIFILRKPLLNLVDVLFCLSRLKPVIARGSQLFRLEPFQLDLCTRAEMRRSVTVLFEPF